MNLLLFTANQRIADDKVLIKGRQHAHIQQTLKLATGDSLRIGELNGLIGSGTILNRSADSTLLKINLDVPPPAPLAIKLVLAMPRPKMFRRTLQSISSLGVKELHLIHSYRVEKSFWTTPWLQQNEIEEQLLLGLEQSGDTLLPRVYTHKRFKPFVEDELPAISKNSVPLVAHPYTNKPSPTDLNSTPITLAVGPEGGFIPYEVNKFEDVGFTAFSLGPRILRVETAIPVLIAKLT